MKTKKMAMVSASALSAGMAHGAILYTYCDPANPAYTASPGSASIYLDLNQNGIGDFRCGFDNANQQKPYISNDYGFLKEPTLAPFVLADVAHTNALPLTTNGTVIDSTYLSPAIQDDSGNPWSYFNQNEHGNPCGAWTHPGDNDGYVGLIMSDNNFGTGNNNYGWAHFVYNATNVVNGAAGTLRIVEYAYETTPNMGIIAGETAEPGTGPTIVNSPKSQVAGIGLSASMSVAATGNPAPTYQWKAGAVGSFIYTNLVDGAGTLGSTSNVLTLSNLTLANQADYVVVVSNINGTVISSNATLSVGPLAIVGLTPSPANLLAGGKTKLTVLCSSGVPITSVQWQKNGVGLSDGVRIAGSATTNLTIISLAPSDTGNYAVVLNNSYGAITSVVDVVTVTTSSVPYENYVSSLGPVEYYPLNEFADPASGSATAFDYASGLNGLYGLNTQNGNPTNDAIAGPLLVPDGFAGMLTTNTACAIVSDEKWFPSAVTIPGPNVNTNTFTITAWIYPTATETNWAVICSFRSPVSGTANGLNYSPGADGLSSHWNDNDYSWGTGQLPPVGQWSFVCLVITPTNQTIYLCNTASGVQFNSTAFANVVQAVNTPGHIGGDGNDANFIGKIDEVAIFNQSLTVQQVTNMYNVAVTGILPITTPPTVTLSITNSGGNVIVSWNPALGSLLQAPSVTGPWTTNVATSPYTTTPTSAATFYKVQTQ